MVLDGPYVLGRLARATARPFVWKRAWVARLQRPDGIDTSWRSFGSPSCVNTCRYDGTKEVRTDSGMRYLDLSVGDGVDGNVEPVQDGDKVTIYFTSRLWGYNGTSPGTSSAVECLREGGGRRRSVTYW